MKIEENKLEAYYEQLDIPVFSTIYHIKDDVCELCGDFLDERSENGYCFNCEMVGNHF